MDIIELIKGTWSLTYEEKTDWLSETDTDKLEKLKVILLEEKEKIEAEEQEHKNQIQTIKLLYWKEIFNLKQK